MQDDKVEGVAVGGLAIEVEVPEGEDESCLE